MILYNAAVGRVSRKTLFARVASEVLKFNRRVRPPFFRLGSYYLLAPRAAVYHPLEDVAHGSAFIRPVHVGHRRGPLPVRRERGKLFYSVCEHANAFPSTIARPRVTKSELW